MQHNDRHGPLWRSNAAILTALVLCIRLPSCSLTFVTKLTATQRTNEVSRDLLHEAVLATSCDPLKFVEGETSDVNCMLKEDPSATSVAAPSAFVICSSNPKIFQLVSTDDASGSDLYSSADDDQLANNFTFQARGKLLGFAKLDIIFLLPNSPAAHYESGTKPGKPAWTIITNSSVCESLEDTENNGTLEGFSLSRQSLDVSVVRPERVIDTIFTTSLIVLVMIAYINMGCTLDLEVVKATLRRPKGPAVGLACQYIFMPLMAYGLGQLLLESPSIRLALLVVGCSPGGGASNIWTVLLDGNVNLSVTMTFVSSIAAFATMPLWIFTLGRTVAQDGDHLTIPFSNVALSAVSFVIPATMGLFIAKKWPKAGKRLVKGLKPFGAFFLLYALTFGVYANVYAVKLLNWKVVIAPMILIWSGFACGAVVSKFLLKFPFEDVVAVALETGIQNTGVAFVVLEFSVGQPAADLSIVIIFMSSMMMPIPPLLTYGVMKVLGKRKTNSQDGVHSRLKEVPSAQDNMTMTNPVANGSI